jgi:hypothetical protein
MSNPDERRSRLERFNDLSFGELRKFIDETLERSSGAVSDADFFPSSKQDFIDLWKILDEKIHPPRKEVPSDAPPPPVYEGPPYVPYWVFEPSDELDSMHERLDRLEDQRDEAIAASSSGRYISFLEDQMGELERQIDGRTSEERREHRESARPNMRMLGRRIRSVFENGGCRQDKNSRGA